MSKQKQKEWYVLIPEEGNGYCHVKEKDTMGSCMGSCYDREVCTCYSSRAIENATEIASLPELQEALQNLVTAFHCMDGHGIIEERYVATLDAAHTALRHSRGRK